MGVCPFEKGLCILEFIFKAPRLWKLPDRSNHVDLHDSGNDFLI